MATQISDLIQSTAFRGYTGSVGSGFVGSRGYTGSVGFVGSASTALGPTGFTGSVGAGFTGSVGFVGSVGYTGSANFGKQTIWIPAEAMVVPTTSPATYGTVQTTTNATTLVYMAFNSPLITYAEFKIRMPKSWNESTITFSASWTANSTSTLGVVWGLQAKGVGNDETIAAAWPTGVTVADLNTSTAYQLHLAPESGAVTVSNAAESDIVYFRLYRDVANASDTLSGDALLLGITIYYTVNAVNDA